MQKSSIFGNKEINKQKETTATATLEKVLVLSERYKLSEDMFKLVDRTIRYSHTNGFVFDGFKEHAISFEAKPVCYLSAETPDNVKDSLKALPNIFLIGVEPEMENPERLCYSEPDYGVPTLVVEKVTDYYVGRKYHSRVKGVEPVFEWADFTDNRFKGALVIIEKDRGVSIVDNGSSHLYSASLQSDLYYGYILKGSKKVMSKSLMFNSYELMQGLGHPTKYNVTVLKGVFLPKTEDGINIDLTVSGETFGEDVNAALSKATECASEFLEIKCNGITIAKLARRNWKFIKYTITELKKVDFSTLFEEDS